MVTLDVKALVFDVFGTVVDWRTSVAKHAAAFGKANGTSADWEAFADGWRGKYQPYMGKVRSGELPWTKLDVLHRMGWKSCSVSSASPGSARRPKRT